MQPELLTDVLRWRLQKPDCDRGVILDGLDSHLSSPGQGLIDKEEANTRRRGNVAKAIATAMPWARLLVLQFQNDEQG